jgi:hypothetical protein
MSQLDDRLALARRRASESWERRKAESFEAFDRIDDLEAIVGMDEISDRLDVGKFTVVKWRQRYDDFPAPRFTLAIGPVWNWYEVEQWAAETGRL